MLVQPGPHRVYLKLGWLPSETDVCEYTYLLDKVRSFLNALDLHVFETSLPGIALGGFQFGYDLQGRAPVQEEGITTERLEPLFQDFHFIRIEEKIDLICLYTLVYRFAVGYGHYCDFVAFASFCQHRLEIDTF